MPNWCTDHIKISGPEADLAAFRSVLEDHYNEGEHDGPYSLLNAFVPMPEEIGDDWYSWALQFWGTKWPDAMNMVYSEPKEMLLSGMTAWSPPIEGVQEISRKYPTLTFVMAWDEPGMQFLGAACFQAGKVRMAECNHDEYPMHDFDDDDSYVDWCDQVHAKMDACCKVVMP